MMVSIPDDLYFLIVCGTDLSLFMQRLRIGA